MDGGAVLGATDGGRHRAPEPPALAARGPAAWPGRWLAWMLAGFVIVGGGLVAGYAALGDPAGPTAGATDPTDVPGLPAAVVPPCDGSYVLIVGSVTTPVGHEETLARLLAAMPGAHWFTTEGTCGSLRDRSDDGTLIHTVYLGPFPTLEAALAACPAGPPDAYARRLDDGTRAERGVVACG